jgi:hypothetical protein
MLGVWDNKAVNAANRRGGALFWDGDLIGAEAVQRDLLDLLHDEGQPASSNILWALKGYMSTLNSLGEWAKSYAEARPIIEAWLATPERDDEPRGFTHLFLLASEFAKIGQVSTASLILRRVLRGCIRSRQGAAVFLRALALEALFVAPAAFYVRHWNHDAPERAAEQALQRRAVRNGSH